MQAALMPGGLVFMDQPLADHFIDDWNCLLIGIGGDFFVFIVYRRNDFLHLGPQEGAETGIMQTSFDGLTGALFC